MSELEEKSLALLHEAVQLGMKTANDHVPQLEAEIANLQARDERKSKALARQSGEIQMLRAEVQSLLRMPGSYRARSGVVVAAERKLLQAARTYSHLLDGEEE